MVDMEAQGRIYMRVVLPEELSKLGLWIEQLVSESLGKHDASGREKGIIAISERDFDPAIYAEDNTFTVRVKLGESDERDTFTQEIVKKGSPLFEFQISTVEEVARVMYDLEFATGMSGVLIGIDPFDQPGVEAKKQITRDMKEELKQAVEVRITEAEAGGESISQEEVFEITKDEFRKLIATYQTDYRINIVDGITIDFGDFVKVLEGEHNIDFIDEMAKRSLDINNAKDVYVGVLTLAREVGKKYVAMLPYDETFKEHSAWAKARGLVRNLGFHDVFGSGPVYEHSYSQFFDQAPNEGILIPIVSLDPGSIRIPGDAVPEITFNMQNALQAFGAMAAEINNDIPRLAIRIEVDGKFTSDTMDSLDEFFSSIGK